MDLLGEERGQSIQIGAIILFGALIILLSTYQAFVIPDQNRGVEFKHSQTVQNDMKELRSGVISVASSGGESSVSVQLGTEYPSRAIFLNPGPPSGSLRTVGTSNASIEISVANATAAGGATEVSDYWNGTTRTYSTGALMYRPDYNEYASAPTTVYSNSVLYNRFADGNLTLTDQSFVEGRSINLIALNRSLSAGQSGSASVDVRATSASATRVPVTNQTAGENVTFRLPTRLSQSAWDSLLQAERVTNGGHVRNVTVLEQSGRFDELVVEMEPDVTYNLKLSRVGVGSSVDTTAPGSYLVKTRGQNLVVPEGQNVTLAVEVRDRYNNPYSGELVSARTSRSDSNITELAESDSEGTVELEYSPPDDIDGGAGTDSVNVSLDSNAVPDSSFNTSTSENVSFSLSIDNTNGSGTSSSSPAYAIAFNESGMDSKEGALSCTAQECTYDFALDGDNQFQIIAGTAPTVVGANVDFALNTTEYGTLSNEDNETDVKGKANGTFDANETGNVTAYISSGRDDDTLPLELINTGANSQLFTGFEPAPSKLTNANGEFVRVYFPTQINTDGWKIIDDEGSSQNTTLPSQNLQGGVYFARDTSDFETTWSVDPAKVFELDTALANSGEPLKLVDGNDNVIDEVAYKDETTSSGWNITSVFDGEVPYRLKDNSGAYKDNDQASDWGKRDESPFFNTKVVDPPSPGATYVRDEPNATGSYLQSVDGQQRVGFFDVTTLTTPGPMTADINGNGNIDAPYVDGNGDLFIIDFLGNSEQLSLGSQTVKRTRFTVGKLESDNAGTVYFANDSSDLYRLEYNTGGPEAIDTNTETANATSVAGIGDFNDDSTTDIVYVDSKNSNLVYLDSDGAKVQRTGVSVGTARATSGVANFDGDSSLEVAYVDGNQDIGLVESGGLEQTLSTPYEVAKTPMAGLDVDDDGTNEVVHINSNNGTVYYADVDGTVAKLTDEHGNELVATTNGGIS